MDTGTMVSFLLRLLIALGLAPALAGPSLAAEPGPAQTVQVTVFAAHYVAAGRAFRDLDELASARAMDNPVAVRLDACGAAATGALLAAAHRLRHAPLELRVLAQDEPACQIVAMPTAEAAQVAGSARNGTSDALERYWRRVMP